MFRKLLSSVNRLKITSLNWTTNKEMAAPIIESFSDKSMDSVSTENLISPPCTDAVVAVNSRSLHGEGKRNLSDDVTAESGGDSKRLKAEDTEEAQWPFRKKKVAMLLVYSGKGYMGMQKNPGFRTIELDLQEALVKAGAVRPDHIEQPGSKMSFQRAARTDKGVSAAGQVVSLKMFLDIENPIEKINENLSPQIRVLGVKRTTKSFDSKNACSSRTYIYVTPTFAFAPIDQLVQFDYRITEEVLRRVQEVLDLYKGSHNFHNFTSGKKPNDPSARRYIMDFTIGKPFERDGLEYVVLSVKGQSFMLHQIRKMVGLTCAICRGLGSIDMIKKAWEPAKLDVPKAPGVGLILSTLHYEMYNKKFGKDGVHEAIEWDEYKDEIEKFKESFIYPTIYSTEKEEQSMMKWLATLHFHHFDVVKGHLSETSPIAQADYLVNHLTKQSSPSVETSDEITISPVDTPVIVEKISDS